MARDGMRDVDLVGDEEPATGPPATPAPGDPDRDRRVTGAPASGRPTRPARRPLLRWLVPVLVLLLAVASYLVVDGVRARDRAARLALVPGVLEPMDADLREVWAEAGGWQHPAVHGPDLIVSIFWGEAATGARLVGNDLETGAELWDVAVDAGRADGDVQCQPVSPDRPEASTHIVCRLAMSAPAGAELPQYGPRQTVRLLALDSRTGEVVADRALDHGFSTLGTIGPDLLVATVLADGHVHVTREDLVTGDDRWSVTSEHPLPGAGSGPGPAAPEIETQQGVVALEGPLGMVVTADGVIVAEWRAGDVGAASAGVRPVDLTVLADGRFVVGTLGGRPDGTYGTVSESDAMDGFSIDGPLLEPAVDDGSADDVLLTVLAASGEVAAVDARTGERVWTADGIPRTEPLVVDRRLITTFGGRLIALDTATGRRLWSGPEGPDAELHLLTDGRLVLVAELGQAETTFTAVDLTDGRVRWTATGPGEVAGVFAIGRRLIALQQEQMFRLG